MPAIGKSKKVGQDLKSKTKLKLPDRKTIENNIKKGEAGQLSRHAGNNEKLLKHYRQQKDALDKFGVNDRGQGKIGSYDANEYSRNNALTAGVKDNVLHKYASYNSLFTLSGINEGELENRSFLTNPVHDVIARSAGIGGDTNSRQRVYSNINAPNPNLIAERVQTNQDFAKSINILGDGRDIFFEDVEILSTVGPSEERGLADFAKMQFKLHEPFGISLIEKVRAATRINGYKDYMDAPILLTIEFKGFDENGISYKSGPKNFDHIRKIPILITRVEFDVNEGGAVYDVTAVRYQDLAFDDRFKFPRTTLNFNADSLEEAGKAIEEQLLDAMKKERDQDKVRQVLDEYKIIFDPEVRRISKGFIGSKSVRNTGQPSRSAKISGKTPISVDTKKTDTTIHSMVNLTRVLEDITRSTRGYADLAADFWTEYLQRTGTVGRRDEVSSDILRDLIVDGTLEKTIQDNPYVDWFKIKTSVKTHYNQFDRINKMHKKTITYRIIPYKVHVLKFTRPGVFMKKDTVKQSVRKRYNYLYTGANADVQQLRISYKSAFYVRNLVKPKEANSSVFEVAEGLISRLLGEEENDNKDIAELRSYPSIKKKRNFLDKPDDDDGKSARKDEFYDYLTNPVADMMNIDLTILGDPAFICQDQFVPLDGNGNAYSGNDDFDNKTFSFNADSHTPLIELVFALPADIDDATGLMFDERKSLEENLFFAGVYQVVRIESSFSNGSFLQTLRCVRLNNQAGEGKAPSRLTSSGQSKFKKAVSNKKNIKNKKTVGQKIKDWFKSKKGTYDGGIADYGD